MFRRTLLPLLLLGLIVAYPIAQTQQEPIDQAVNARIRAEGMDNSQIMRTMHFLTDVYGPRLTGSPNHENAAKWAVQQMEQWGMTNGKLEPFEFRTTNGTVPNGGWLNEKASGHILAPVKDNLVFEVLAWTPSTRGTVTADAVHLVTPLGPTVEAPVSANVQGGGAGRGSAVQRLGPTQEELDAYFASIESRVRNGIVLVGNHTRVPFQENPPAKRQNDDAMRGRFGGEPTAGPGTAGRGNRGGGPARGGRAGAAPAAPAGPPRLNAGQVNAAVDAFLLRVGAGLRINDAGREHGQIRAFSHSAYDHTKTVPTVVLRNEDDGALWLGDGRAPLARFEVQEQARPESAALLQQLRNLGLRLQLLSGDAVATVQRFASALGSGFEEVAGRMLPEDKLARVRALQARGRRVAMVGDGINDAPVLAGADVSIAVASGAALARQSADMALLQPSLTRVAEAIQVARRTRRIVRQNLAWAIAYNAAALPLAAAGLIEPWAAALAMVVSSLTVTLNSLRLARSAAT